MKGHFSRLHRARAKGYSRVMMQQGRVLLDSDWNEQADLVAMVIRDLSRDIFGPHGGPEDRLGFKLTNGANGIQIGQGRYYVQGMMASNAEWEPFHIHDQLGYDKGELPDSKPSLGFLDVWEGYVSPEQDSDIIEVALGGPDTCGRARIFWRVRFLELTLDEHTDIENGKIKALDVIHRRLPESSGEMSARTDPGAMKESLCVIPPDSRYSGLENQLYRVEIHVGGAPADAHYKWSRDNGAIVYPVTGIGGSSLELAQLGRDSYSMIRENMWVEYVDDDLVARASCGIMARVTDVNRDESRVELEVAGGQGPLPDKFDAKLHPLLRRWDHGGDLQSTSGVIPVERAKDIELEDGIRITFNRGNKMHYNVGDYWLIPARAGTQDIDWPVAHGTKDTSAMLEPRGMHHLYAPLALLRDGKPEKDLRIICSIARRPAS